MSGCGCAETKFDGASAAYRRALIIVIAINAVMFVVEMTAGIRGQSMALQADALDFLGDTATYALSLWVIGQSARMRASAALVKGLSLGALGLWIFGSTAYQVMVQGQPEAMIMTTIGALAFVANAVSALILLKFRDGDANVRSVWLCSRNDAIGNLAVIAAAGGVVLTGSAWPDLVVAAIMATLFLQGAISILRQAAGELSAEATVGPAE